MTSDFVPKTNHKIVAVLSTTAPWDPTSTLTQVDR